MVLFDFMCLRFCENHHTRENIHSNTTTGLQREVRIHLHTHTAWLRRVLQHVVTNGAPMLYEHGAKVMLETKQLCRKFERKHLCSGLLSPKYCRAYNCQPERAPKSSLVVLNAVHLDLPWRFYDTQL